MITRARALCRDCAELREYERHGLIRQQAEARGLFDDELRWAAQQRIIDITGAVEPDTLTLEECYDLLAVLKSIPDNRTT